MPGDNDLIADAIFLLTVTASAGHGARGGFSFKTLAIQKRSSDVWEVLGAVKTEFDKFSDILTGTQKKLNQINSDLDKLIGTRTNVIMRKLRDVEKLDEETSKKLLEE